MLTIFGRYLIFLIQMWNLPDNYRQYRIELAHQCAEIGWRSTGIVIIISLFIGGVSTIQTAYQLISPLIPQAAIAQIVRETVLLEFAPTLVCIVLSGVIGSKITSELGNMRITEQIDAMDMMGIHTKTYLVLIKVIASVLMIPILVVFSAFLGIMGGRWAGSLTGIISTDVYDQGLLRNFSGFSVSFMLIKAYCFSFLIASIHCFFGYYADGGSIGVGRNTTRSVISTCIAILATDYILSLLLL